MVAQSKGNDATQIGIVFSVYPFIGFISSPLIGKMVSYFTFFHLKPKRLELCTGTLKSPSSTFHIDGQE